MNGRTINLLPERSVRSSRRARRLLLLSRVLLGVGFLIAMLAVFSVAAWRYLVALAEIEEDRLAMEGRVRAKQLERAKIAEDHLDALAQEVRVMRELKKPQYDPSRLIAEIVGVLPAGAKLATVNIRFEAQNPPTASRTPAGAADASQHIFLSGSAATRGDVLSFEHALEGLPFVAAVEGPLENIIKPVDVSFTFDITLKPLVEEAQKPAAASPRNAP